MRMGIVALAMGLSVYAASGEGCTGGSPEPGQGEGCNITTRGLNSAGKTYISTDCNADGTSDGAEVLPDAGAFPNCIVGTYWPRCKG